MSCGYCGCPLGPNNEIVDDIPDDYDPDDYDHEVCSDCADQQAQLEYERELAAADFEDTYD